MTVVGVAAAGFRGVDVGAVPAFWIPTSMYADANFNTDEDLLNSPARWLQVPPPSASWFNPSCSASLPPIPRPSLPQRLSSPLARSRQHSSPLGEPRT